MNVNQRPQNKRRNPPSGGNSGGGGGRTPRFEGEKNSIHLSDVFDLPYKLGKDFWERLIWAFDSPFQAVVAILSIIASVIAIFDKISGSGGTQSDSAALSILISNAPMRLITFALITISIAGAVSSIGKIFTKQPRELSNIFCHVLTFLGAFFLISFVFWIFLVDLESHPFLIRLIAASGMAFAVFLIHLNFFYSPNQSDEVKTARASLIANFAISGAIAVFYLYGKWD